MNQSVNQIRLGLPKGSLNTVGRANTCQVFLDAGYDIRGYEPGAESPTRLAIVNDPEIIAYLTRPQSAPVELAREMLDIAIVGDDWIREENPDEESSITRIGDLDYGHIKVVVATRGDAPYASLADFFRAQKGRTSPVLCFTEYPKLTREWFVANEGYLELYGDEAPRIQVRGLASGKNKRVQILGSDGVTEAYVAKGADLIVDVTQTGASLREHGLKVLETVMDSSTGLYAGPSCTEWKAEKARQIFDQLRSVMVAKGYFDVKFDVPNDQMDAVRKYLIENQLCCREPTISPGENTAAMNILIRREKWPFALGALRSMGAIAIARSEVKQVVE